MAKIIKALIRKHSLSVHDFDTSVDKLIEMLQGFQEEAKKGGFTSCELVLDTSYYGDFQEHEFHIKGDREETANEKKQRLAVTKKERDRKNENRKRLYEELKKEFEEGIG